MQTAPTSAHRVTVSSTKELTGIALFTAMAIALGYFHVPAPFAGFLQYEIWEIPIAIAFLMLGIRAGVTVSIVNFLVLLLVNQGAILTGPLYNLIAVLSMLFGVGIAHRITTRATGRLSALIASATTLGIASRTIVMTIVNGVLLEYPPPLGFSIPGSAIPPILLPIALFNASLALYTIPVSYWALAAVSARYKIMLAFPLKRISKQSGNTLT